MKSGGRVSLAAGLVVEKKAGLSQAARTAGISPSEMMDILAEHKISLIDYSADEVTDEVKQFAKN